MEGPVVVTLIAHAKMREWAGALAKACGGEVAEAKVFRFADGEIEAMVEKLKGEAWVVQTCAPPVQESLMELLLMVEAAHTAGAKKVGVVVPYLGYARQDRELDSKAAVGASLVGKMLRAAGVKTVVTAEIHSDEALAHVGEGAVSVPVLPVIAEVVAEKLQGQAVCVVAPDAGSMVRAKGFAECLREGGCGDVTLAMVDKRREQANTVASATLVGEVEGRHCVLVDDMIDTAGTLCAAVAAVREGGASAVSAAAAHGLFSGPAVERLLGAGLEALWVSDTLPLKEEAWVLRSLKIVPVAAALAGALPKAKR